VRDADPVTGGRVGRRCNSIGRLNELRCPLHARSPAICAAGVAAPEPTDQQLRQKCSAEALRRNQLSLILNALVNRAIEDGSKVQTFAL
jgi:hypothetical protein